MLASQRIAGDAIGDGAGKPPLAQWGCTAYRLAVPGVGSTADVATAPDDAVV